MLLDTGLVCSGTSIFGGGDSGIRLARAVLCLI